MLVRNFLSPGEIAQLQSLAKLDEWLIIKRLVERVHDSAKTRLSEFKDPSEAFERRGVVKGVDIMKKVIEEIPSYSQIEEEANERQHRSEEAERINSADKYDRAAGY